MYAYVYVGKFVFEHIETNSLSNAAVLITINELNVFKLVAF